MTSSPPDADRESPPGLSSVQAAARLKQHGPNRLQPPTQRAVALQFLAHFKNPLLLLSVLLDFVQADRASRATAQWCDLLAVEGGKQWFYKRLMKA